MSNRTERDQGFGPIEMRAGHADFPGWRGLQRTGDTVLKPGRFFRAWNAQINDGEITCRGGQTEFSSLGTAATRPQCITSIFSTNIGWPDVGQLAEILVTAAVDMTPQSLDEPTSSGYFHYRGDVGGFTTADNPLAGGAKRQMWLRDGADNTSSGRPTETATNSSVRIRDRVYVADLNGAIRYLSPGSATYTTLAAAGVQFGAGSRPLAMSYKNKLVVVGDGVLKHYNIDTAAWTTPAMPGGTTGFVPKGWTLFDVDDCLYVWGTVGNDAKLLKVTEAFVITVVFTLTSGVITYYQAVDLASNNGHMIITYTELNGTAANLVGQYSTNGTAFSSITVPTHPLAGFAYAPSRMTVAGGMIWSSGMFAEDVDAAAPLLMYSYDGTEWLAVDDIDELVTVDQIAAPVDIVQVAPVDLYVSDTTAL